MNGATCRAYVEYRTRQAWRSARPEKTGRTPRNVSRAAARRELEDLRAAINHHRREGLCSEIVSVVLPEKAPGRERWLTRSEAARLLWAAWRAKQIIGGRDTQRPVGRHIARFILVGLYTGTRSSAICGAAMIPIVGRGHVDLNQGVFYRGAIGRRQTKKRQPPVKLPPRLLAHMRRWARLGFARRAVVEWNGKPVRSVRKGFEAAVRAAKLDADVTPHVLRHTCATWLMQGGVNLWDAAGFLGMTVQQLEPGVRSPPSRVSGTSGQCPRGPVGGTKRREQSATNGRECHKKQRSSKGSPVAHLVRDEGVAGSNPATPTNKSPDRSMSFRTSARTAKGALGQLLGQKRRSRLPPPPDPENGSPGAVGTATGAEVQSVLRRTTASYPEIVAHASPTTPVKPPAPLRIVIEPTASGRKWTARLGDRVLCVSASPFVRSARLLLDEGYPADAVIEMWRPDTEEWALRGRLGAVAAAVIDGKPASRRAKNGSPARDSERSGSRSPPPVCARPRVASGGGR